MGIWQSTCKPRQIFRFWP